VITASLSVFQLSFWGAAALFSFSEHLDVFDFCDVFEASFYQLSCFSNGFCGNAGARGH